jgi:PAS domain S-box-containing protein
MSRERWHHVGKLLLFAASLLLAAQAREFGYSVLDQAVMWLPTGVAFAGLWLMGLRTWWLILVTTTFGRLIIGYHWNVAIPGALGSTAEAVIGVVILHRLGFRPQLERLRDVLAVVVAAIVAPVGSIFFSWLGRSLSWTNPSIPLYSGWGGWWRMNALGALAVLPVAVNWLATPRPARRRDGAAIVVSIALIQLGLVAAVFAAGPDGVIGIMLLNLTVLVSLYAAVRLGPRGAVTAGSFAAVLIALATANGLGPFLAIPRQDRHVALQLLELLLVGLPLLFGALVAERRAAEHERERSRQELHESRELLASIHRNVNEGLYRSRPDGALLYVNEAFARMFGYDSPEQVLAANAFDLHADPQRRRELMQVIAERGFTASEEIRFRRRDGSEFWGLVSSTAVRAADGTVTCLDGAITDITAWKSLEEQLRQSQRLEAVGQLAGGIAHDFNNVLTVIVGYAELIRAAQPPTEQAHMYAQGVLKASERAANLTRQLLAYSRRQVLSPQVLDLGAVVQQLADMTQRLIGEDVHLHIDADPRGSWALVDRGQMEQVILNLVVNARDAMPGGGAITITTEPVDLDAEHVDLHAGPYVKLVVRDTGTGMPPEVKARAFDPFFTTKERGKGSGLGLSTVYGIIKQSGGSIAIDSEPGCGAAVTICLPRVEAVVEAEPATVVQRTAPTTATLLFVEDEPLVRELTVKFLNRSGFTVFEAADGVEALELSRRHEGVIDLLVTDVVMPRMGGRELALALLAERPRLRVLFISGYTDDAGDLREVAGDAGDFLQKPFRPEVLVARVRGLLERADSRG